MPVTLSSIPDWICPHCFGANEAFGPARCQHCSLTMLSDAEQHHRITIARPAVEQLTSVFSPAQSGKNNFQEIQPQVDAITLLTTLQPEWAKWLSPVGKQMAEWKDVETAYRRQWRSHLLILGLLILVPILVGWMSADWMLVGLLSLPIAGWAWIGLFEFRRKNKP